MSSQPKRPRPSPATNQAEAIADVERIAAAIYEQAAGFPWDRLRERGQERWRSHVRALLHRDVIRVGARPNTERAMIGQTTIDEQLDDLGRADERDYIEDVDDG